MFLTIVTAAWRPEGVKNVIEKLKEQTYQNWEHIVVNDCSPNITHEQLVEMCSGDDRRFWIDLGIRTGYYGAYARAIGIQASFHHTREGLRTKLEDDQWILLWDDDNEFYPDFIERMVKAHEEHPECTLLGADIEIRGKINKDYKHVMKNVIYPQNTDLGAWLYKRDLFNTYGFWPASLRYKITYDFELIKKIHQGEGDEKIYIDHSKPGLQFFHKER